MNLKNNDIIIRGCKTRRQLFIIKVTGKNYYHSTASYIDSPRTCLISESKQFELCWNENWNSDWLQSMSWNQSLAHRYRLQTLPKTRPNFLHKQSNYQCQRVYLCYPLSCLFYYLLCLDLKWIARYFLLYLCEFHHIKSL